MHNELVLLGLFLVASTVAVFARWAKVPYTVALVVAGLVLGSTRLLEPPHLTRELLFAVFLPGLVFEAAFHLEARRFWQNRKAIVALAVPGLVVAIAATAGVLTPAMRGFGVDVSFGYTHGLVLAALLAATDPIAVVSLFRSLGAPQRLSLLVEGESLLNDGTAVVVAAIVLDAAQGRPFGLADATLTFVRVVGLGALLGAAVGYAASQATRRIDDPMVEITLTTLAAYGSFGLAERAGVSGVIATVAAGMVCGSYGARVGMSPTTRLAVGTFWEYVAFALNSAVFLLLGFEVHLHDLLFAWRPILLAFVAVLVGRAAVVVLVRFALYKTAEAFDNAWAAALTWAGLRGGLSMVLALGLPTAIEHRTEIIRMTVGVVVLSILVQGLSMGPMLRWLGLARSTTERGAYERERGHAITAQAALETLATLERDGAAHPDVLKELRERYQQRARDAQERLRALHLDRRELRDEEEHAAERALLLAEKDALLRAVQSGTLGADGAEHLLRELDGRLVALEDEHHGR